MLCNWTIEFAPQTVTIDPERGPESGAHCRLVSDWGDDFQADCCPHDGYSAITDWARALDAGIVPDFFWDVLPDLTHLAVYSNQSGSFAYQVDLAERQGLETARAHWARVNG